MSQNEVSTGAKNKNTENIFSISEYIDFLNAGLKNFAAKIIGEVSQVDFGPTGHVYFRLKDEKDGSILKCIIWKSKYDIFGVELKEGVKIVAFGSPNIHQTFGFSFIAETIELAGEGLLKKEYEKLKKKLTEEGIFAESRKRIIPKYPQKIGVITSRQGAVLADFLSNLGKHNFKIKMIDSRVEGQAAVSDLLSSIKTFKKYDIEVLVIMRGGGSLESMLAFNNEFLVREISAFPAPVIVAIGHHKDVPLAALAADRAVDTPSIAATTLSESWERAILFLERYAQNIIGNYGNTLNDVHNSINRTVEIIYRAGDSIFKQYEKIKNKLIVSAANFQNALSNIRIDLNNLIKKSFFGFRALLLRVNQELEHAEGAINSNNPERQLMLGYSIASCGGKIIRQTADIKIGDDIDLKVIDGKIISRVKDINKINKNT